VISPEQTQEIRAADVPMLDFGKSGGLLPAIVQDATSGAVLMLGYMNAPALEETLARKQVVFFSRSRQRLWMKGETSGAILDLAGVFADCDRDALLVTARPRAAVCHRGTRTCFGETALTEAESHSFLHTLESVVEERVSSGKPDSYTARLFAKGTAQLAQKVGEEALEVALASLAETDERVIGESADLLFHLLVLLRGRGLKLDQVLDELRRRHTAGTRKL
jgi:phosphoribosyl-AMP cyclohydrolase / phosphoribosyl-ATP pyrophosphohydrolase